jgi:shikimate kinase
MTKHVVLVGMMGAGKTTVGRALAARLQRPFVDSDQLIEAATGRTVREIWEEDGEPAFRVLETSALVDALSEPEPLVIAAAGGTVLRQENRDALERAHALVVWLRADPGALSQRVTTDGHRPLLDGDPEDALRRLLPEREHFYAEVAHAVVDTDAASPDDVLAEVLAVVEEAEQ